MDPIIQNDLRDFIQGKSSLLKASESDHTQETVHSDPAKSIAEKPVDENALFVRVSCEGCGRIIPEKRIEAMPGTKLCVGCANNDPAGQKARAERETWGSREDWKRDSSSWKRSH